MGIIFKTILLATLLTSAALGQTYTGGANEIPIGGPLRSSYVGGEGMVKIEDLDGGFVKAAEVSGNNLVLTVQLSDNTETDVTFSTAGASADGVLQSAAFDSATKMVTFTLSQGGTDVELDLSLLQDANEVAALIGVEVSDWAEAGNADLIPDAKIPGDIARDTEVDAAIEAIRNGLAVLPDSNGDLPDPADNQDRFAVSGNQILKSINHGGHDKEVTFKRYGTRTVLSGEPAKSTQENNYQGAFNNPPAIASYDASDILWDRGSQIWLFKQNQNDATWRSFGGPVGFSHGSLYADEATAAQHVGSSGQVGKVYVIGTGSGQHVFIVTAFTAATDDVWHWDPLGVTLGDVQAAIAAHNEATDAHEDIRTEIGTDIEAHNVSGTAHSDIRSDVSTVEDRLDALNGVEIEPYSSSATYSRGSANSIVTHSNGLFIYISSTERSGNHDPDNQPGYWLKLSEGVAYEVISSGSHRIAARTLVVDGATDQVYLCTTTQTTPRDLTYIKDQAASIGGTFIELTAMIPTTWKGPHVIGQDYEAGDRVTTEANSQIYTARVETDETPPHADWIQTGPVGAGGGGFTLRQGSGAPGSSLGDDGDWYLRTSNGQWYERVSGSWESRYIDQIGQAGSGLTAVSTTVRLSGDGTSSDPLDIADDGVVTGKIADDAVTGAKIADDTIHGGSLIDGTIATVKIGDSQVTGAKLSSNAVSTAKVADDAITQAKIADDAVGVSQLADGSVNTARLATGAVTASKVSSNAVTTAKIADDSVTTAKLADNAAGEGKVPIDNTLQFDGSGNLGVQISTVTEHLDEDIRYYSTDTTREDAHQASKGVVFQNTSRFAKKIHSVEWDFEGDGIGNNYATFLVGIDSSDDISIIYGQSDVLFNVTTSGTHRTMFGTEGVRVPGDVERLGVFLTRTGSPQDATHETKVYRGQPADDSPRESYPSASLDFPFWRSARFDSSRPEIGEHIDNYITNGEIYGYPKIRYSIEVEHAPFVGDESVSASHISSGSSADGTVLTADGSGGAAFEAGGLSESEVDARVTAGVLDFAETGNTDDVPLAKIPGGVTHIESGATYNNNVITVSTAETVRGGDGILFAVPTPFGSSATQAVSLAIDGQSNSEHPLHDRNGDALHEDDLTDNSVYIAISDASSWDILVLPTGSGAAVSGGAIEEFDSTQAYSKGEQSWTGTDAAFTVWTANQDISASSTTPTRELPQNWIVESGPGSIRGLLSPINVNALRVGDIFWHEEISDAPKVYFTRTAGNYSNTLGDDPDDFIELTVATNRLIPLRWNGRTGAHKGQRDRLRYRLGRCGCWRRR